MKIEALQSFTAFTDQMNVFNAGDTGELPDNVAAQYIESGMAKKVKGKAGADAKADAADLAAPVEVPAEGDAPA